MAGDAPIDPIDGGEVEIVVEPRDHHLLDPEIGLDEIHQRKVEQQIVQTLVEIGDTL